MLVYEFNYDSSNLNCKWIVLGNKKLNRGFCQDPSLHFFSSLSTMTIIIIKNNNCKTQSQKLPKSSTDVFLGIVTRHYVRQSVSAMPSLLCQATAYTSTYGFSLELKQPNLMSLLKKCICLVLVDYVKACSFKKKIVKRQLHLFVQLLLLTVSSRDMSAW